MTRVVRGVRLRAAFVAPDVDADVLDASSDLARRFRRRRDATRDARSSTPSRASSSTDADARAIATARDDRDDRDDDAIELQGGGDRDDAGRVRVRSRDGGAGGGFKDRSDARRRFRAWVGEMARMGFVDDGTCAGALVRCGMDVARAVETALASR